MALSIKKVAVYGGTGNLGPAIVHALLEASFEVLVLSRKSSHPSVPSSATLIEVDPSDSSAVTSALKGVDAFVSAVGSPGLAAQPAIFQAAIDAGVKFIIPSEFGSNTANPKSAALPVFGAKIEAQKWLVKKAEEGKVHYAFINNGAFLDWGLEKNFIVNVGGGESTLWNGGDVEFSTTTLADIGKAVAGVLKDPEEFKDRFVYINSAVTTQNKLLAAAKEAGKEAPAKTKPTEEQYNASMEIVKSGKGDIGSAMIGFLMSALFDPSYGPKYDQEDSKKLGIKVLSDAEVDQLVTQVVKK